jgi:LPXTG-site transpeptidase (sortase) family protein
MPANKSARRSLFSGILATVGLAFVLLVLVGPFGPDQNDPATLGANPAAFQAVGTKKSELPSRLNIPKIGVNAPIEHVGLTRDGAMDVPQDPSHVAWFEPGPRPGQAGSAVIDGHFDWDNGTPAVFDNLDKLRVGDKLLVRDRSGATITFLVHKFRVFQPDENAASVFRSDGSAAHLNLITCTGIWNEARQSYSGRLVVFSDREVLVKPIEVSYLDSLLSSR